MSAPPKVLILNKVDLVDKPALLTLAADAQRARDVRRDLHDLGAAPATASPISSAWLAAHVPAGPWHYPEDQISDAPLRQLAAEITREKLFLRLHQELPYQSTVETEVWKELKDGSVRIEQTIYVERESQRKIVLGKGGQTIKAIGAAARKEIADDRSSSRCTCSCSSRCARAGATIRSAIARWGWSFRRSDTNRQRAR